MFKLVVLAALLALAAAVPAPKAEAKAEPKPGLIAAAYTAPYVAAAPFAYSAPLAYSSYVAPAVHTVGYTGYSPYAAPLVVA